MKITAIVDASRNFPEMEGGVYTRMMKQTTVLKKQLDTLRQTNVDRIIVITGYDRENLEKHIAHRGTACVYAANWESARTPMWTLGLKAGKCSDRVLVLQGNMPLLSQKTIRKLIDSDEEFLMLSDSEAENVYAFSCDMAERIYEEAGTEDANRWILEHKDEAVILNDVDEKEIICIHTEEDMKKALEMELVMMESRRLSSFTKLMISKGDASFGPGVARFFTLIDETGSMAAACKSMEMSYSRGWTMVKSVEDAMGFPFLERKSGGKGKGCSKLTDKGREFLNAYYAMQEDIQRMSQALFALHFGDKF